MRARFAICPASVDAAAIWTSGRASGLENTDDKSMTTPWPDIASTDTVEGPSNMPRSVVRSSLDSARRTWVIAAAISSSASSASSSIRRTASGSSPRRLARSTRVGSSSRSRWRSSSSPIAACEQCFFDGVEVAT